MNGLPQNLGQFESEVPLNDPMNGQLVPPRKQSGIAYCCAQLQKCCSRGAGRSRNSVSNPVDSALETGFQLALLKEELRNLIPKNGGYVGNDFLTNTASKRSAVLNKFAALAKTAPALKAEIVPFVMAQIDTYSKLPFSIAVIDKMAFSSRLNDPLNFGTEGRN